MSASTAITAIKTAIEGLTWVTSVIEEDRDPGGVYSVYMLANGLLNSRELVGVTTREYRLALRLIVGGKSATTNSTYEKMVALEEAVEGVSTVSGGNQIRPLLGEEWEPVASPVNGYMAFETDITLTVRS